MFWLEQTSRQSHDAQAWPDIITPRAPLGGMREPETEGFDTFDVGNRGVRGRRRDNPVVEREEIVSGFRRKETPGIVSRAVRPIFCMAFAQLVKHPGRRNPATGIGLHGVLDGRDLLLKPAFNGRFALLKRAQFGPYDLFCRRKGARRDHLIDMGAMFFGKTDGSFRDVGHALLVYSGKLQSHRASRLPVNVSERQGELCAILGDAA